MARIILDCASMSVLANLHPPLHPQKRVPITMLSWEGRVDLSKIFYLVLFTKITASTSLFCEWYINEIPTNQNLNILTSNGGMEGGRRRVEGLRFFKKRIAINLYSSDTKHLCGNMLIWILRWTQLPTVTLHIMSQVNHKLGIKIKLHSGNNTGPFQGLIQTFVNEGGGFMESKKNQSKRKLFWSCTRLLIYRQS